MRQGTDADALAAELATPEQRRRYIATFYTSRFWAHPGAFIDDAVAGRRFGGSEIVDFHTEPFADAAKLRAWFGALRERVRPGRAAASRRCSPATRTCATLILFGPSDHVLYPDFDRMAAVVFPDHVGPFLLRDCGHFVPWEAPGPLVSGTVALCSDLLGPPVNHNRPSGSLPARASRRVTAADSGSGEWRKHSSERSRLRSSRPSGSSAPGAIAAADVVTPPGACHGAGVWQGGGFTEDSANHVTSDVIKIPREDTVLWSGELKATRRTTRSRRRDISGKVQVAMPKPFGLITIDNWGGYQRARRQQR